MNPKNAFTKFIHMKALMTVSFSAQLQTCGLIVFQKRTPPQMLLYENYEGLQNIIFTEQCCMTASDFL